VTSSAGPTVGLGHEHRSTRGPYGPPPREPVPVTRAILSLNLALFGIQLFVTRGQSLLHLPEHEALAFGACDSLAVIGDGRWETLLTACFLHDGVLHLAFNLLVLWQAGPIVERSVGSARMAPMYLLAGAGGCTLGVLTGWYERRTIVGASGAICGVIAAALVVGWRVQGWRGPLTQAMIRWLAFVVVVGLLSRQTGVGDGNATHLGGAVVGALVALSWRRYRYPDRAARWVLAASAATLAACVVLVGVHDRVDRFATMTLSERSDYTSWALAERRCDDARDGLRSVERLRARLAPVTSLHGQVEAVCGGAASGGARSAGAGR
jgi:rhomboid protease GluP